MTTGEAATALEEAADWTVRMDRASGEDDARALEAWLETSQENQEAYAQIQGIWDDLAALPALEPAAARPAVKAPPARRLWATRFAAVAASIVFVFSVAIMLNGRGGSMLRTDVGGRDIATLEDGSRVTLNTDTEMHVVFAQAKRTIILDRGEAMFEVKHDADRPFVVEAAGRRVTALGTVFVVRRYADGLMVTLLEGRVRVDDASGARFITPGQRLNLRNDGTAGFDRPEIDRITSWRRGELVFQDTPIVDAVAEMNRYARKPIQLSVDPGDRRVSGIFATSGARQFGEVIAELYGWSYREQPGSAAIAPAKTGR